MAFRRFFSGDPYGYFPTAPSYSNLREPTFSNLFDDIFFGPSAGLFSPVSRERDAKPEAPRPAANNRKHKHKSIPIHVDGPDTKAKGRRRSDLPPSSRAKAAPASVAVAERRAPSAEAAAVRLQAAARGFLARRSVQVVREVERKVETLECILREREEELREDQSARVAAGEVLMGMLLRLDAVRRAREYRRRVARKVLALQDFVDAHEPRAPAGEATAKPEDEVAEEGAADPVLTPQDAVETKAPPAATATEPEVAEEAEPASNGANPDGDKPDGSDADAEWEILKEEEPAATAAAACPDPEAPRHDPAGQEIGGAADAGAGVVDTGKLMEMVAALCERNAEQCALIGALAERVDALERTVRRMEDAERRA